MDEDGAGDTGPPAPRRAGWIEYGALALLYGLAVLVYYLAGRGVAVPIISPDEYSYGHVARSLADGDGMTWGGAPFEVRSALYMYLIAPLWALGSQADAYAWTKLFGAVVTSAVVFPTWALARLFVGPRMALVPAALSVAGSWMTVTSLVVTETVALPLAVASLAAMVLVLLRPGWRWTAVALVLAALATWARSQMVVLPFILLLAVLVDALCQGAGWRERLTRHRALLVVTAGFTALALVAALAFPSLLGRYAGLVSDSLHLDRSLDSGRDQVAALLVMSGFLPLVVALAGSLDRSVWRSRDLGPLLAVTWTAVLVLLIQSTLAVSFWEVGASIERYVVYCVPLLLVVMTVMLVRDLVDWRRLAAVAGGAAVIALLISGVRSYIEEPALFGLNRRTDALLGSSTGVGMAVVLLLLAAVTALLLWRRPARPQATAAIVALLTAGVLIVQSQSTWAHREAATGYWRSGFPANLSWIDDRVDETMAHFVVFRPAFRHAVTEFFNRRIIRTYAFDRYPTSREGIVGRACSWSMDDRGFVTFQSDCGPAPTRLLIDDEAVSVTFHDERVLAYERGVGRVVEIPARAPRILAIATPSCTTVLPIVDRDGLGRLRPRQPLQCNQTFGTNLFTDEPAALIATFRGGRGGRSMVAMGDQQRLIAPGETVKLRSRQPAGPSQVVLAVQPYGPAPKYAQLVSLELVQDGERTQLLY